MASLQLASPDWRLTLWSMVAAFGTYFCMYAFRKPFTVLEYAGETFWNTDYKSILLTAQVGGYMLSKFIGIKIIAEMPPQRRAITLLTLIGIAEIALLAFAIVPTPYNFVCLFFNGLPLGMVFGLVLGFLEGRRVTEALTAGLCASFIVADGLTKSVGAWLLQAGVAESWMPVAAGALFILPLCCFVWMLSCIPLPSASDVLARNQRTQMNANDRWRLFRRYWIGLTGLVVAYLLVTILRSLRADFATEIWRGLGFSKKPDVFANSELLVALGVLVVTGAGFMVRDNRRAFFVGLSVSFAGAVLVGVAAWGLSTEVLSGFTFMVLVGLGLYLPYVAIHTTIFERMMAMTRERGNIGYLMYLADAFGYLGFVSVMLCKGKINPGGNFLPFFLGTCWVIAGLTAICLAMVWFYFVRSSTIRETNLESAATAAWETR